MKARWLRRHPLISIFGLGLFAGVIFITWRFQSDIAFARNRVAQSSARKAMMLIYTNVVTA